jgi:hypothetical protein
MPENSICIFLSRRRFWDGMSLSRRLHSFRLCRNFRYHRFDSNCETLGETPSPQSSFDDMCAHQRDAHQPDSGDDSSSSGGISLPQPMQVCSASCSQRAQPFLNHISFVAALGARHIRGYSAVLNGHVRFGIECGCECCGDARVRTFGFSA